MQNKFEIIVKLSRERVEALYRLYDWLIGSYAPNGNHEHLLYSHGVAMYWRLESLLLRDFKTIKFKIYEPEAIALCLLWSDINEFSNEYDKVVLHELIGFVDKRRVKELPAIAGKKMLN